MTAPPNPRPLADRRSRSPTPTARSAGRSRCRSRASRRSTRRCTASSARCPPPTSRRASARRSPRCCATRSPICTPSSRAATRASRSRPSTASSRPPSRRIALWQALWEQYSACLKPLLEGDPELRGRQAQAPAARTLRRQAARARLRPRAARAAACVLAGAARVLPARRDARLRGDRGVRRADAERRRHLLLFDVQPRAAARPRRSLRDVREADRAHRPLARHVGAQGLSRTRSSARPKARSSLVDLDGAAGATLVGDGAAPTRRRRCASAIRASSRPACADA